MDARPDARRQSWIGLLALLQEVRDCEADVFGDLPQENWREIPPFVDWDGCEATVCVLELLVRSALANLFKPQRAKDCDNLAGLEDRRLGRD